MCPCDLGSDLNFSRIQEVGIVDKAKIVNGDINVNRSLGGAFLIGIVRVYVLRIARYNCGFWRLLSIMSTVPCSFVYMQVLGESMSPNHMSTKCKRMQLSFRVSTTLFFFFCNKALFDLSLLVLVYLIQMLQVTAILDHIILF